VATSTTPGGGEQEHAGQQQEHTEQREALRKLTTAVALVVLRVNEMRASSRRWASFWRMREDDRRLLFITFIGGLAANIGLVIIVGLGLVMARLIHRYPQAVLYLGIVTAGMIILVVAVPVVSRAFTFALAVLLATILFLGLVGYAAGIR
jgi:hypothetical protein